MYSRGAWGSCYAKVDLAPHITNFLCITQFSWRQGNGKCNYFDCKTPRCQRIRHLVILARARAHFEDFDLRAVFYNSYLERTQL